MGDTQDNKYLQSVRQKSIGATLNRPHPPINPTDKLFHCRAHSPNLPPAILRPVAPADPKINNPLHSFLNVAGKEALPCPHIRIDAGLTSADLHASWHQCDKWAHSGKGQQGHGRVLQSPL